MKKIISVLLASILACTLFACAGGGDNTGNDGTEKEELKNITVAEGYDRYDIGTALPDPTVGFGAQIDTDVYMPWNHLTEAEEAMLEQRIADMNFNSRA